MKTLNYKEVTISNLQDLIKTGYITEIVCDADNRTINIKEAELIEIENIINQLAESLKPVVAAICEIGNKLAKAFISVFEDFKKALATERKMSKKRFMKLLQSEGIQRNTINEIVKGNKEPYTYARYYNVLINFKR